MTSPEKMDEYLRELRHDIQELKQKLIKGRIEKKSGGNGARSENMDPGASDSGKA